MIRIKKGLDIPISGEPSNAISDAAACQSVALVGYDYVGMKPTMLVQEGERVKTGQPVFTDKKTEGVVYTSPATGVVRAINRGAKRVFESIVIDVEADDFVEFDKFSAEQLGSLSVEQVKKNLVDSGLWTALRTRPLSKVPTPESTANSIFVAAIDTNPLAGDPSVVIAAHAQEFNDGLRVLSKLGAGPVYVATADDAGVALPSIPGVQGESFAGPHPAGLVGTHIHHLDPVSASKTVWTVGYQDVIAIGHLFNTGRLWTDRVISLAGPLVKQPRLVRTRLGANVDDICAGELNEAEARIVSGSVLSGRHARADVSFIGRYHVQVSVLAEGRDRAFMGWLSPGAERHSVKPIYLSSFFGKGKKLDMTTNTNGSCRAIVPIGAFEQVMPLDILPTPLLKALAVGDIETAQNLGALELDEEDLGLCTYVCPGKYEYGRILRDNLSRIEKEG